MNALHRLVADTDCSPPWQASRICEAVRIPNWLVLAVHGLPESRCPAWLHGWHGIGQSVGGLALATLVLGAFFWMGGMGMGRREALRRIGAWIGPSQLILAMVITAMAGGVMALAGAICGGFLGRPAERFRRFDGRLKAARTAAASGTGACQPAGAKEALRSGQLQSGR